LPAKFTALDTVLFNQGEGIGEDQHGVLEADAVFALVGFGVASSHSNQAILRKYNIRYVGTVMQ